jgi:hypothetical protein
VVLLERTGEQNRGFEPKPADEIRGLSALQVELDWVVCTLREFTRRGIHEAPEVHLKSQRLQQHRVEQRSERLCGL